MDDPAEIRETADFTHVRVIDAAGATIVEHDEPFCPNGTPAGAPRGTGDPVPIQPDAPSASPYPRGCPLHPFTRGAVLGLQAGWGASSSNRWYSETVQLPDGAYRAVVTINRAYRHLFDVPAGQASATIAITVRTTSPATKPGGHPDATGGLPLVPASPPAAAPPTVAHMLPLPDLQPLPAWAVTTTTSDAGDDVSFATTIWNAGTAPLLIDGFRRSQHRDLMDAYQYLDDRAGTHIAHRSAGTLEWDPRPGHQHWHFTGFATYRLVDSNHHVVAGTANEAFCLSNTDAIDYTLSAGSQCG